MKTRYLRLPFTWSADTVLRRELSAEAFRTYVFATLWCGKELTDGWISHGQALETVAIGSVEERQAIWDELVEFGLAVPATRKVRVRNTAGYELSEFLNEQQPAEFWEDRKRKDRERQARSRATRAAKAKAEAEADSAGADSAPRTATRARPASSSPARQVIPDDASELSWHVPEVSSVGARG